MVLMFKQGAARLDWTVLDHNSYLTEHTFLEFPLRAAASAAKQLAKDIDHGSNTARAERVVSCQCLPAPGNADDLHFRVRDARHPMEDGFGHISVRGMPSPTEHKAAALPRIVKSALELVSSWARLSHLLRRLHLAGRDCFGKNAPLWSPLHRKFPRPSATS